MFYYFSLHRLTASRFLTTNTVAIFLMVLAILVSIVIISWESLLNNLENEKVGPLVHTTKGTLRGIQERSFSGRPFFSFYAIPYAKPPLGKLRLQVSVFFFFFISVLLHGLYFPTCVCLCVGVVVVVGGWVGEGAFLLSDCCYFCLFYRERQVK